MGFFSGGVDFHTNPFILPAISGLEQFGAGVGLGKAGKTAKHMLNQMESGDYGGTAGTFLSPIHDRFAADTREAIRSNSMGGNAFVQGSQPALMANIEQDTRRKMAEGEGLAYGQAIPQLYSQAASTFQNALNTKEQMQLAAQEAALRARLGASQAVNTPSTWQNVMSVGQGAGQLAALI
jgi:hypothetical protein